MMNEWKSNSIVDKFKSSSGLYLLRTHFLANNNCRSRALVSERSQGIV